jgi:hypothetical protein
MPPPLLQAAASAGHCLREGQLPAGTPTNLAPDACRVGPRLPCPAGGSPTVRQAALHTFLHDPSCRVLLLLMSNSSGAAGLTLTAASTAFILDPPLHPGMEAQVRLHPRHATPRHAPLAPPPPIAHHA